MRARKLTKKYDATIIYSEYDEVWVRNSLLPLISKQGKAYKLNLLTSYHKGFAKLDKDQLEKINSSKRLMLIFSKQFLKEEWKSENLQSTLKTICANDDDCVLVPIALDGMTEESMNENIAKLEEYYDYDASCYSCSKQIKHSTILKDIEPLNCNDETFAEDLCFIMPLKQVTGAETVISDSAHVKSERHALSPFSLGIDSDNGVLSPRKYDGKTVERLNNSRDDAPLIGTIKKSTTPRVTAPPSTDQVLPFNDEELRKQKRAERKKKQSSRELHEKLNRKEFLSPSEDESIRHSSRGDELTASMRKSTSRSLPRELPDINSSISRHKSVQHFDVEQQELSQVIKLKSGKTSNRTEATKVVANNVSLREDATPDHLIPVNHGLNMGANYIIPVVSASSGKPSIKQYDHHQKVDIVDENDEEHRERKHKRKHKHKHSSRKSRNEENVENLEYNIMPMNAEDTTVTYVSLKKK